MNAQFSDKKLLQLLEAGQIAILGEEHKSAEVRVILIKTEDDGDYVPSGRVVCTFCKTVLSSGHGGHVKRHLEIYCPKRKARNYSKRQFTRQQVSKLTAALAKHALVTGKSFNYVGDEAMKDLLIETANATGSGIFGKEARAQLPHRQTIQKHSLIFSNQLIARAYEELKPHVAHHRVHLLVDHGKIVGNYLSMFASFIDDTFQLRLIPIGFIPSPDGKSGAETAKQILERLQSFGWSEEEARSCAITADGALSKLGDHFSSYIRCVSHSINLLAERVVHPLEDHKDLLDPDVLTHLSIARDCLQNAQNVSSAIRNNFHVCNEMSRLPTLPNDTRWLNGLKCLKDVTELSSEILDKISKLSVKGRTSMNWILDNSKEVNAVLHFLKPLLIYCDNFQKQGEVTIHQVLPAYRVLKKRWTFYENGEFVKIKERESMDLEIVQAMATAGMMALNHYFDQFGEHHFGATLLCPRTKLMTNFSVEEQTKAQEFILNLLPKETKSTEPDTADVPEFILEMSDNTEKRVPSGELKRYMDEEVNMRSGESVEQYWRRKRLDFPGLYQVALKILAIIPSESICETTFSTASFLLDKRRTRLRMETVEKIVVGCQIAAKYPEWVRMIKID